MQSQDAEAQIISCQTEGSSEDEALTDEMTQLEELHTHNGIADEAEMPPGELEGSHVGDVQAEEIGTVGTAEKEENKPMECREAQIQELVTGKVQTDSLSAKMTQCGDLPLNTSM